jgi:Uma2 family endonuclease
MATVSRTATKREVDYPTSDGKPMGETDLHRQDMVDVIDTLADRFAPEADVYVTGNLLLFYEEGNRRKHISPDVFVVRGVPKLPPRDYYLLWKEGRSPDAVIEITSRTTRREDQNKKLLIYRDILKVLEYFQFDPTEDYLKPPLQGFRLVGGEYLRIEPVEGRLPSQVLGLHLERDGSELRLYDPVLGVRLLTSREQRDVERREAEEARAKAEEARAKAEEARAKAEEARAKAEEAQTRAEEQRVRAEEAQTRDEEQRVRAEEENRRAEQERRRVEEEKKWRLAAEAELERLRAENEALRRKAGESG